MEIESHTKHFPLGTLVITRNAGAQLHPEDVAQALARHARGEPPSGGDGELAQLADDAGEFADVEQEVVGVFQRDLALDQLERFQRGGDVVTGLGAEEGLVLALAHRDAGVHHHASVSEERDVMIAGEVEAVPGLDVGGFLDAQQDDVLLAAEVPGHGADAVGVLERNVGTVGGAIAECAVRQRQSVGVRRLRVSRPAEPDGRPARVAAWRLGGQADAGRDAGQSSSTGGKLD